MKLAKRPSHQGLSCGEEPQGHVWEGRGGGNVCVGMLLCDKERRNSKGDCNHIWVVSAETEIKDLHFSAEDR